MIVSHAREDSRTSNYLIESTSPRMRRNKPPKSYSQINLKKNMHEKPNNTSNENLENSSIKGNKQNLLFNFLLGTQQNTARKDQINEDNLEKKTRRTINKKSVSFTEDSFPQLKPSLFSERKRNPSTDEKNTPLSASLDIANSPIFTVHSPDEVKKSQSEPSAIIKM